MQPGFHFSACSGIFNKKIFLSCLALLGVTWIQISTIQVLWKFLESELSISLKINYSQANTLHKFPNFPGKGLESESDYSTK